MVTQDDVTLFGTFDGNVAIRCDLCDERQTLGAEGHVRTVTRWVKEHRCRKQTPLSSRNS